MTRLGAILAGLGAALLLPVGAVLAHPIGNFTINHFAGLTVTPEAVHLDLVIDQAEIPTFQERIRLDRDEDGIVSDAEAAAAREPECLALRPDLVLTIDGQRADLRLVAAGLSFPGGAGGLSTMRLVCEFVTPLDGGLGASAELAFEDRTFPTRIGWREIVAFGAGVAISGPQDRLATSLSRRLTSYPPRLLAAPPAIDRITVRARATGEPWVAPRLPSDATTLAPEPGAEPGPDGDMPAEAPGAGGQAAAPGGVAAVPGGVSWDLPAVFGSADLSPAVVIAALALAVALGAGHALTPGHGKSLIAAYLVGRRGTVTQAAGLGVSVAVAHTAGILLLGGAIVVAGSALPADLVVRWLPAVAAATITALGAWMVVSELRRASAAARPHAAAALAHGSPSHDHGSRPHAHEHPAPAGAVSWRGLAALGLAGGIVPSTSALLILLAGIAAGRPAFGLLLVVAFGFGMAWVMSALALALVLARDRLAAVRVTPALARIRDRLPLAAAGLVLAIGLWMTGQSLLAAPTL